MVKFAQKLVLSEDRLFPSEIRLRSLCKELYSTVKDLPIVSPHGHTDAAWFSRNEAFANPTELLLTPDHYILRMLYSQGIAFVQFRSPKNLKEKGSIDPRHAWQVFAQNYFLFRGTPSKLWLDHVLSSIFEFEYELGPETADQAFNHISERLASSSFLPRALFDRFNIEVLATTDSPLDSLADVQNIAQSNWQRRIIPTFRPDPVCDPDHENFKQNVEKLGLFTNEDTTHFAGYLNALKKRRRDFIAMGATASDHGHPTAKTLNLSKAEAENLFKKVLFEENSPECSELFRAQMLTEMARMSLEDGLVMQIHPGSHRNHNALLFSRFGRDVGADIPTPTEYVQGLKPLLHAYGNETNLKIIVFTLDESTYSRELAPLAGHYPALKLGPPWWFHDSPEGMLRFRQSVTETAGFYNTVGFNDDTRAFFSIPARHDVARRMDAVFLARLVSEHRVTLNEAHELMQELSYKLVKKAYNL